VNRDWYLSRYPDVRTSGVDPVRHFLRIGARIGNWPNPLINPQLYLDLYPDVVSGPLPGALHYYAYGRQEGRTLHPLFDEPWYLQHNPDVLESGENPLEHFLRVGGYEGRSPHPLFDCALYLDTSPTARASGINPLVHYLEVGEREGLRPNPLFDPSYYRGTYPDVVGSPLLHYVLTGRHERRRPHPAFDPIYYIDEHPDIAVTDAEPLANYLHLGRAAGYRATPKAADEGADTREGKYERYLHSRIEQRQTEYEISDRDSGLLSFLTPVYDTPGQFIDELAHDLFTQDCQTEFEWIVVDNGSKRPDTIDALRRLESRSGVRLLQIDENVGIVRAMRYALHQATGRYVLPLDSDDCLTPDCIRVVTSVLQSNNYPAIIYTDEHLTDGSTISDFALKPDWDPVYFVNACYIAHLTAFDRQRALGLGVYDDVGVEGCHDWDTFTRFMFAGHIPLHIAEDLYGWRQHSMSAASGDLSVKPYIEESQRHLLTKIVAAQPKPEHFEVEHNPLALYDWRLRRTRLEPVGIATVVIGSRRHFPGSIDSVPHRIVDLPDASRPYDLVSVVADAADRGELVHLLRAGVFPIDDEWPWDAMGLFELFPDAVAVGGPLLRNGQVIDAGRHLGFGWGCGSPLVGRGLFEPGYSGFVGWKQHSVSAVSASHAVFRAAFLSHVLKQLVDEPNATLDDLGSWFGLAAVRADRRVIFSPFTRACCPTLAASPSMQPSERAAFVRAARTDIPDSRYLSPHASLSTPFAVASDRERLAHIESLRSDGPAKETASVGGER
jgi:Glycosyl transferase family 2